MNNFFPLISHLFLITNCLNILMHSFNHLRFSFVLRHQCWAIKAFANVYWTKVSNDEKENQETISDFYYLAHLSCSLLLFFADFLSFLQDTYRLWPFFKSDSCPGQRFRSQGNIKHEENSSRPRNPLKISSRKKTVRFKELPCNFMQISNQSQYIKYANDSSSSKLI